MNRMEAFLEYAGDAVVYVFSAILCILAVPFVLIHFLVIWITGTPIFFSINGKRKGVLRWFTYRKL